MKKITTDQLFKLLGSELQGQREEAWLWFYLCGSKAPFNPNEFGTENMRTLMAELINSCAIPTEKIISDKIRSLIPSEYIAWIKNDTRQLDWLKPKLLTILGRDFPSPVRLLGRDEAIAIIDSLPMDIDLKAFHLVTLERSWQEHKYKDSFFKWFNSEDSNERCALAWEWLIKNNYGSNIGNTQFTNHEELLAHFDKTNMVDAEKILCVSAVKKRWTQLKYREKLVGRKQYNFVISDEAINNLDQLAKAHNLKRNLILEKLIQIEKEKGLYLSNEGMG